MRQKVSAIPIIAGPASSLFAAPRLWNKAQTLILLWKLVDETEVEALPGLVYIFIDFLTSYTGDLRLTCLALPESRIFKGASSHFDGLLDAHQIRA